MSHGVACRTALMILLGFSRCWTTPDPPPDATNQCIQVVYAVVGVAVVPLALDVSKAAVTYACWSFIAVSTASAQLSDLVPRSRATIAHWRRCYSSSTSVTRSASQAVPTHGPFQFGWTFQSG